MRYRGLSKKVIKPYGLWKIVVYNMVICLNLVFLSGCTEGWVKSQPIEIVDANTFIDSMGNTITVDEPYTKVVSLYSAHTENAYTIGAGSRIIGASATSIYPPPAAALPRYDYKSDPEPLISANPDLVIVRPFINRNYNDYIKALDKAGIPVVSLYPASSDEFEPYVTALGMLLGAEEAAASQLAGLNDRLAAIEAVTATIPQGNRVNAYFESTKTAYRTVTVDSNPAKGIAMAGGNNIADDVEPITKGSTIAEFGIERLMINAENIDVYVSQRGAMNAGGSLISIPQREGFKAIKAVSEGRILEINEKIISSPTFRYDKGVREMARMFYPELMDDITALDYEALMTREDYAVLTVKLNHTPIFVPSSSHYYEKDHKVHTYGYFRDVYFLDETFDYIETAVLNSFIRGYEEADGTRYFDKEGAVTREDLAYTLYMMYDIDAMKEAVEIEDLALIEKKSMVKIIEKVVSNGYMTLDNEGNFNPQQSVTGSEAIRILSHEL